MYEGLKGWERASKNVWVHAEYRRVAAMVRTTVDMQTVAADMITGLLEDLKRAAPAGYVATQGPMLRGSRYVFFIVQLLPRAFTREHADRLARMTAESIGEA